MNPFRILLHVIVPPIAVYLKQGMGTALAVNIVLTLLGWLPGVIHALMVNEESL
ncbi:YqaE/Pmp3 family membrane protein [uncultured Marixanthomonas sp.]|uniref:YqaE/Pmp3 family membrane protein n=1 Tax=uncultured Marixanthomonas sp. TaxID=757245 RepID=UPI0030D88396|tara:strand:- start:989 stop:1150 length:162 start_codon:yes stop_codon:yes gene_type:complete